MGITKAPSKSLDKFIQSAPDGIKGQAGNNDSEAGGIQITLRLSKEQLARVTQIAQRQGIPRASYIKRAVFLQVEQDEPT